MNVCKACEAPIIWAHTSTGKAIPLDAEKVDGGNLELKDGTVSYAKSHPDVKRYRSHFATCPKASSFRRSRERSIP
jgi:hypothetical protein